MSNTATDSKTYREHIQDMVATLWKLHDQAEWLRDCATGDEQKYWNEFRGKMYDQVAPLQKLDDSLSDSRARSLI